ncbi:MAG: DUF3365 domain-containing protein, partial [Algicola sp.]|nr:DUF3365 domain-containing protein [Algicola sp.]
MKKHLFATIISLSLLITITSCNQSKKTVYTTTSEIDTVTLTANQEHPGKALLEKNCYVCHNPTTAHNARIAPPMVAVKSHYMNDDISKEAFGNAIWDFVKQPSEENSKMRGAVRRFGVMPYQLFSEEDIKLIADYMYDHKIDEPEWFKQHIEEESHGKMKYRNDGIKNEQHNNSSEETKENKGLTYALNTKKELGKNLMGTIQKKGTLEAVAFCNQQAYPITDSMAQVQNVAIKRVSDNARNPNNQANSEELVIIKNFKKHLINGETDIYHKEKSNGHITYYYPIITNSMCLQCHGQPLKDIAQDVFDKITTLYPSDQ